ncbi:MAG: hypothetical protein BMS9Abin31_0524 [Gammaproteobacteria bacterium]|nr:MAG: hypothetical protein BMS9Abin31_0524 [Gammaproteobacteria bacterium]
MQGQKNRHRKIEFFGGGLSVSSLMSTPERAFLELLDELPQNETFHMVDVIMEGLVNLSPRRMQSLLESCMNIKVKRLFFFSPNVTSINGWRMSTVKKLIWVKENVC